MVNLDGNHISLDSYIPEYVISARDQTINKNIQMLAGENRLIKFGI